MSATIDFRAQITQNGVAVHGIPVGGTANQVLSKVDGTDFHVQWSTPSADHTGESVRCYLAAGTTGTSTSDMSWGNTASFADTAFDTFIETDNAGQSTSLSWFDASTPSQPKITAAGVYVMQATLQITGALSSTVKGIHFTNYGDQGGNPTDVTVTGTASLSDLIPTATTIAIIAAGSTPSSIGFDIQTIGGGNFGTLNYYPTYLITKLS